MLGTLGNEVINATKAMCTQTCMHYCIFQTTVVLSIFPEEKVVEIRF